MSDPEYKVEFTTAASRQFRKLDSRMRKRIAEAVKGFETDPRPPGVKKLSGRDAYRVRIGDYRVIYEIEDDNLLVTVIRIGDRKDVYGAL